MSEWRPTQTRTRENLLALTETMLDRHIIKPEDFARYARLEVEQFGPESQRLEWEDWYRGLGIEIVLNRRFRLSECPFSAVELQQARALGQAVFCVPAGVSRRQLGTLFRFETWALRDPLVGDRVEQTDLWFLSALTAEPDRLCVTGMEVKHDRAEGSVQFNLERYMVFAARYATLKGNLPDLQYWIWLPGRSYDRSGMLIAGFDRNERLSVHGWMPHFSASFLGARSASRAVPKH